MTWSRDLGITAIVIFAAGCGTRTIYPVQGQIVDKAGNAVVGMKGSTVTFESADQQHSANGVVDENGKFSMSTKDVNDGAHVGKYRVAILRPDSTSDVRVPHVIDPKYESFDTSGLTVTVENRTNNIKLEVELNK